MRGLRALVGLWALAVAGAAWPAQVRYMLWDSLQLPAYRQCARDFERLNPGITIRIQQAGWGDYWTTLSTGFIADVAPDVFTHHLSQHAQFVANGLLEDLTPYIRRDRVDLSLYPPPLLQVWARDGRQYGLPKDWDTVSLMVNLDHAQKAGVSLAELQQMRWNPVDGGSFETVMRRLTRDRAGRNALDPAFDRRQVAVYGYQLSSAGGMAGQVEWSHFAASNGFRFQEAPWALPLHYGDPRLVETIDWLAGLPGKGLSAPFELAAGIGSAAMFAAGKVAMVADGAWMINYYAQQAKFRSAWVPLPVGPIGRRATMLNGLSDALWAGSRVKEEAWRWVRYLGSPACQSVVAAQGATFPAVRGLAEQVVQQHARRGLDAQAFLQMSREHTFLMPVAEHGAQVDALVKGAIESALLGRQRAGPALQEAQSKIDRLFQPRRTP